MSSIFQKLFGNPVADRPIYKVHVFMKSGKTIILPLVYSFSCEKEGCQVTTASWEVVNVDKEKIINLNVDQIEAVISERVKQ